jgi:hypothetical protein
MANCVWFPEVSKIFVIVAFVTREPAVAGIPMQIAASVAAILSDLRKRVAM